MDDITKYYNIKCFFDLIKGIVIFATPKFGIEIILLKKKFLCSPNLHVFYQKYSKTITLFFLFLIYFLIEIHPVMENLNFVKCKCLLNNLINLCGTKVLIS